jgi:hypothetical protein
MTSIFTTSGRPVVAAMVPLCASTEPKKLPKSKAYGVTSNLLPPPSY